MKQRIHRLLAMTLCLVMVFGLFGGAVPVAGATEPELQQDKIVYAQAGETTFVPAGYTYVYESADGSTYTKTVASDAYVSFEALSPQEAEALANLELGEEEYLTTPEGEALVARTYNAQEAAQLSSEIQAIMGEQPVEADQEIQIISSPYTAGTLVRAMITFTGEPVIRQAGLNVALGQSLGAAETQASRTLENRQDVALASIGRALGHALEVDSQFTLLTNAAAVTVPYGELAKIRQMDGVENAYVMPTFEVPEINAQEVTTLEPDMKYVAPGMGATTAWDYGFDGTGISVAIIDSGLVYANPVFSILPTDEDSVAFTQDEIGEILANNRLHAEEMDASTALDTVYYSSKIPFGFGYGAGTADFGEDVARVNHGTHVAGIVAGNLTDALKDQFDMETMGIAPEAQLLIMNVSDRSGTIYFDSVLAAMEDCITLGVDCANLSLGSACGPVYLEGMTEVFDAAYRAGINVMASAGNEGFSGYGSLWGDNMVKSTSVDTGTVGFPGSFDAPLTVASAENAAVFYVGGNALSFPDKNGGSYTVNYSEMTGVPNDLRFRKQLGGQTLEFTSDPAQAEGKLLFSLVEEGADPVALVDEAVEAGAAGLILLNGYGATLTEFPLPVANMGSFWFEVIEVNIEGNALKVEPFWNPSETAGEMSDFSSWGPTGGLTLKPEITGIGGNVFSAYGVTFAVSSGTSMSSPAVAASGALVRQYLQTTNLPESEYAHATNCLLMSTATPIVDEDHDTFYFVRRQGAGMANIGAAVASDAYIQVEGTNKAKLELGDDPQRTGVYEMTFEVVNFSNQDKTYTLDTTVLGQKAVGGLLKYGEVTHLTYEYAREMDADVTYSAIDGQITVPAGQTVEVTATVALTQQEKEYYDERFPCGAYVEGFIQLISQDSVNLSVPFLGFYGDFSDGPTLEDTSYVSLLEQYPYTTADQVQTAMFSDIPTNIQYPFISSNAQFYLGDTRAPMAKVPAEHAEQGESAFYSINAGISPNDDQSVDGLYFGVALTRNAENIHYTVTDRDTGEVLWEEDTGFMNKTYNAVAYFAPSLEWLFPVRGIDMATGMYVYDFKNCLLEENTLVDIHLEVTPETGGETEVLDYTLYIDTTPPMKGEDFQFGYQYVENEWFSGWQFDYYIYYSEDWFVDYTEDYFLTYQEELGQWGGSRYIAIYVDEALREPAWQKNNGEREAGRLSFGDSAERRFISTTYDYAGNVFASYISTASDFSDTFDVTAERTTINVGDTLTVESVSKADGFKPLPGWSVSDPEVAELLTYDYYDPKLLTTYWGDGLESIVVRGLQGGRVTVTGSFAGVEESIEILVMDENFEVALPVIDRIDALPEPEAVTTADEEAIAAARTAYDGLTDEQKAMVDNLDKLEACEEALELAKQAAADQAAADEVEALIDALPAPEDVTTADEEAIAAARAAYDGLTDAQKALVENLDKLTACEAALETAKQAAADQAAASAVDALIAALPAPEDVTTADGEAIAAARAAYDKLTGTQKTLVENLEKLIACELMLKAEAAKVPFTDVSENMWYYPAVSYVYHHGIMDGVGGGRFAPNNATTRGMLVTTLYRLAGSPQVSEPSSFTDVAEGQWYANAIAWAEDVGIAQGVTETRFAPGNLVTREQAATFLYRFVTGYLEAEPVDGADLTVYTDAGNISGYAEEAIAWATAEGLFEGFPDGSLRPQGTLTRAQMAKLLTLLDQTF